MQERSLVIEGVVDVGILVPCCFDNPLKQDGVQFLEAALGRRRNILVPVSAVIGAYHIATNYLKVSRVSAKTVFSGLLNTGSPSLFSEITLDLASSALDHAVGYGIESWDGYLVAIARKFDAKVVYSMDEELGEKLKTSGDSGLPVIVNPFPAAKVKEYHHFLEERTRSKIKSG